MIPGILLEDSMTEHNVFVSFLLIEYLDSAYLTYKSQKNKQNKKQKHKKQTEQKNKHDH